MSTKPTQPNEPRQPSQAEIEADKIAQHFHRVFGKDAAHRSKSQKYIIEWLEATVGMPCFTKVPTGFCATAAALNDGQRIIANHILKQLKSEPVTVTTKPTVTK